MDAPKKKFFYALHSWGEQVSSPDVVLVMLQVFFINVYALLDSGDTLSFVTPLITRNFDIFLDILNETSMGTTLVGVSVVAKRVYRNFTIMLPYRVTHVELVELDMVDFDVIFAIEWLHDCLASIDCRRRFLNSNLPNEPFLEWKGGI